MKIIWCDGYNRESVAERLVAENVKNKEEAEIMVNALIASCCGDESQWYRVVEDDKKLWGGMAEFV